MPDSDSNAHRLRSTLSLLKMRLQIGGYPRELLLRELEEAIALLEEPAIMAPAVADGSAVRLAGLVKVVVVDDEPQLADVLARRLQREGLATRSAHDLDSAEEASDDEVVILDLSLLDSATPDQRSWAAHRRPVVITGASSREAERLLAGIDPFAVVQKPFSSEELASLVRRRAAEGRV